MSVALFSKCALGQLDWLITSKFCTTAGRQSTIRKQYDAALCSQRTWPRCCQDVRPACMHRPHKQQECCLSMWAPLRLGRQRELPGHVCQLPAVLLCCLDLPSDDASDLHTELDVSMLKLKACSRWTDDAWATKLFSTVKCFQRDTN